MKTKIILASGSKQRKLMMEALGISFVVVPADINEKEIRNENLEIRAEKIARAKAEKVAKNHQGIIISADTFSACDKNVLEKPKSLKEASKMLKLQANKTCILFTGFCYLDKANGIDYSTTAITKYVLRKKNNPVLDWSASFSPAYPYQMGFIKEIEGSLTGLTHGLPVELLIPCLEKSGVKV